MYSGGIIERSKNFLLLLIHMLDSHANTLPPLYFDLKVFIFLNIEMTGVELILTCI